MSLCHGFIREIMSLLCHMKICKRSRAIAERFFPKTLPTEMDNVQLRFNPDFDTIAIAIANDRSRPLRMQSSSTLLESLGYPLLKQGHIPRILIWEGVPESLRQVKHLSLVHNNIGPRSIEHYLRFWVHHIELFQALKSIRFRNETWPSSFPHRRTATKELLAQALLQVHHREPWLPIPLIFLED